MPTLITLSLLFFAVFILGYNAWQSHKWHQQHTGEERRVESEHYSLYIFYFNKDDKRIFIPKKSGGGYTINFANPVSILSGILLIAIFLLYAVFSGKA